MVAPTLDQTAIWDVAQAALAPLFPAGVTVYRKGDVPGSDGNEGILPQKFVTLHLERRYIPASHASRLRSRSGWRMVVRAAADMARNAEALLVDCSGIEDAQLVVGGGRSTPVEHESSEAVKADDGKFSAATTYTFTL